MAIRMAAPMKHPATGVYWFRKVVPPALRAAVGKREIKRTLGTKDAREARRRYAAVAAEVERLLAAAERGQQAQRLTFQQVVALSADWYRTALAEAEPNPAPADEYELLIDLASDAAYSGERERSSFLNRHLDVGELLTARGLVIDAPSRRMLEERLFSDLFQLWRTLLRRAQGNYSRDPHLDTLPPPEAMMSTLGNGDHHVDGVTFAALLDSWALDAHPTTKARATFTRYFKLLAEDLGHDDAARVTRKDVVAFKEARLAVGKAPKTVATELSGLGAVFAWAERNERLTTNPARRVDVGALKAARRRGDRPRYPYSQQEAVTILEAARRERDVDLRWLPWICALTGARISEVVATRGRDVQRIALGEPHGDAWFLAIGMDGQTAKTGSSRRRVPLHPALLAEGFMDYAATKGADARLFSTWGALKVTRWVRSDVGITDPKKGPSHSWRHRWEDEGRAAGIPEDIRDALAGHSNKRIGREYGAGYGDPRLLGRLVEAVAKIPSPLPPPTTDGAACDG
jgi:integrase